MPGKGRFVRWCSQDIHRHTVRDSRERAYGWVFSGWQEPGLLGKWNSKGMGESHWQGSAFQSELFLAPRLPKYIHEHYFTVSKLAANRFAQWHRSSHKHLQQSKHSKGLWVCPAKEHVLGGAAWAWKQEQPTLIKTQPFAVLGTTHFPEDCRAPDQVHGVQAANPAGNGHRSDSRSFVERRHKQCYQRPWRPFPTRLCRTAPAWSIPRLVSQDNRWVLGRLVGPCQNL